MSIDLVVFAFSNTPYSQLILNTRRVSEGSVLDSGRVRAQSALASGGSAADLCRSSTKSGPIVVSTQLLKGCEQLHSRGWKGELLRGVRRCHLPVTGLRVDLS